MRKIFLLFLMFSVLDCSQTDYYSDIKKECKVDKAEKILTSLLANQNPQALNAIDAISDCNSEDMDRLLSDIYTRSNENIKRHIYLKLTKKKSKAFLETAFNILINKVQTKENYDSELKYINETDPEFLSKKYKGFSERIEEAKKNKNKLALEILLENIKALSLVTGQKIDETTIKKELRSIKEEEERNELYNRFIDATNNQEMILSYNVFKKLKERNLILQNNITIKLEETLKQISEVEEKFYETANRQDKLMIEIEKKRRESQTEQVKRLEEELKVVKAEMVFKKRALDRAAKRLETVRELFEQVKIK